MHCFIGNHTSEHCLHCGYERRLEDLQQAEAQLAAWQHAQEVAAAQQGIAEVARQLHDQQYAIMMQQQQQQAQKEQVCCFGACLRFSMLVITAHCSLLPLICLDKLHSMLSLTQYKLAHVEHNKSL